MIPPNDPAASPYDPNKIDTLRVHTDDLARIASRLDPLTIHPVGRGLVEIHATRADRTVAMHVHEEDAPLLAAAPALLASAREASDLRERLDEAEMRGEMMAMAYGQMRGAARCLARVVLRDPDAARAAAEAVLMSDEDFDAALTSGPGTEHRAPKAWALYVLCDGADEFFASIGADNYVERTMSSVAGRYVVTVQRLAGKTPANVAREALAERDSFKANFRAAMDAILGRCSPESATLLTPEGRARAEERHEIVNLLAGVLVPPMTAGEAIVAAAAKAVAEGEGSAPGAWSASASPGRTAEERHRLHDYSACVDPDCERCKEIGLVVRERLAAQRVAQTCEPVWSEIDTSSAAEAMPFWRKFVAAAAECPEDLARFVPVMKLAVPLTARLSEITLAFDHRDTLLRRQMLDDAFTRAIAAIGDRCFGKAVMASIAQGILPPDAPTLAREDEAARAAGEVR